MSDDIQDVVTSYFGEAVATRGKTEVTYEQMQPIIDYVRGKFPEREYRILAAYESFNREFTRGHRCSVCGRTEKQNEAISYDCHEEC